MKEGITLGNLLIQPRTVISNTNLYGSGSEGAPCYKDGKQGKLKKIDDKLTCVVEGSEMNTAIKEAATTLTFSSPSRDALAKAYTYWKTYNTIQIGSGRLIITYITGSPGAWSFTVSSNTYDKRLDPALLPSKIPANVSVSKTGSTYVRPAFDSKKKASSKGIQESIRKNTLKSLGIKESSPEGAAGVLTSHGYTQYVKNGTPPGTLSFRNDSTVPWAYIHIYPDGSWVYGKASVGDLDNGTSPDELISKFK